MQFVGFVYVRVCVLFIWTKLTLGLRSMWIGKLFSEWAASWRISQSSACFNYLTKNFSMNCFEAGIHNTFALYWAIALWQEALLAGPPGEGSLNRGRLLVELSMWAPLEMPHLCSLSWPRPAHFPCNSRCWTWSINGFIYGSFLDLRARSLFPGSLKVSQHVHSNAVVW